jgi:hypothetical protein
MARREAPQGRRDGVAPLPLLAGPSHAVDESGESEAAVDEARELRLPKLREQPNERNGKNRSDCYARKSSHVFEHSCV